MRSSSNSQLCCGALHVVNGNRIAESHYISDKLIKSRHNCREEMGKTEEECIAVNSCSLTCVDVGYSMA